MVIFRLLENTYIVLGELSVSEPNVNTIGRISTASSDANAENHEKHLSTASRGKEQTESR